MGRAIFLEEHEPSNNIDEICYPFFDYDNIPDEDYIQVDTEDLGYNGRKRKEDILRHASNLNIPISLLKKNKYISFEKQIDLILKLRGDETF
ncbi:hypothetical protein [Photobacterium leiognathi]|uniref:hypothetical protein n=1 Tax=Photobacterium leiognathi TaxID=553611 RepID=UPI0027382952|nr:hypothetical protein [Photobacterium leiognathi]